MTTDKAGYDFQNGNISKPAEIKIDRVDVVSCDTGASNGESHLTDQ